MVFAQFEGGFAVDHGDGPGVSCVGAIGPFGSDEYDVGSAASMRFFFVLGSVVFFPHFLLDGYDFSFATLGQQQFVHLDEGFLEGLLIVFPDVAAILFELLDKVPFHEC